MKNRDLELNNPPTPAELYALEQRARAVRAAEIARLVKAGLAAVRAAFASRNETKELRHA